MQVLITNTTTDPISLDFTVGEETIRETVPGSGYVDVGDRVTIDDLNRVGSIRTLVAAGTITISTVAEAGDIESLLDSQLMEFVQETAANQAEIMIGTADMAGTISVEAQVGALPASGEDMTFDVLVNGSSILASALVADDTTVTAARQTLYGDEGGATVVKGDKISIALVYTAGGSPTPIVDSALRIKILKAS